MTGISEWTGICPDCGGEITIPAWPASPMACPYCTLTIPAADGVSLFLRGERLDYYRSFLEDYTRIRHAEGRGSNEADYYLRLPEPSESDPMKWQWKIRNVSYRYLFREFFSKKTSPMKIADLGAGVGWLSYRLATLGHQPIAVDLSVDRIDGLAAGTHYGGRWPRIQAEFDRLPLGANQADMVIYNASFHYSTDYRATLGEALRVLRRRGLVVIMDSPVYKLPESGERMKAERHDGFERQYGFRSDSIGSIEYLTWSQLDELGSELGLGWNCIRPGYGLRWQLRPLLASIKGRREPSQFVILIGAIN